MNITAELLRSLGTDRRSFDARCDQIAALVQRNDKAALEAMCRIYDRQTADEKAVDHTRHDNGIGFQQSDAKFGGFIARLHRSGRAPYADRMARVRKLAVKYRRQLAVLSFEKDRAKAAGGSSWDPSISAERRARIEIEEAVREARKQAMQDGLPPTCERCGFVTCPDGCCCGC